MLLEQTGAWRTWERTSCPTMTAVAALWLGRQGSSVASGGSCPCGLVHIRAGSALPHGRGSLVGSDASTTFPVPITEGRHMSAGAQKSAAPLVFLFWGSTSLKVFRKYREKEKHKSHCSSSRDKACLLGQWLSRWSAQNQPLESLLRTNFLARPWSVRFRRFLKVQGGAKNAHF